jgi:1,4-dihydroxy-2-naphthoate octaprenyltransferase
MSSEAGSGTISGLKLWLFALRAPFLTASAIPVLVGTAAAFWAERVFEPLRLALALGGVVALHLGANLANDYFDYVTGCDQMNPEPTPFSGGSRVIQNRLIASRSILAVSLTFFAIGGALGLILNAMVPGNRVLYLGIAGLAGGLLYSAAPAKLSYRGIGEIVVFALFGPLAVAGAYLSQTGRLAGLPFAVSMPCGLLVLAILLVNEVLDARWDLEAGKRTVVARLGARRGYLVYLAAYFGAYAWLAGGLLARIYSPAACLAFIPAVLSVRHLLPARALSDRAATVNASRLTVISHTATGCLIAASYLVWPLA